MPDTASQRQTEAKDSRRIHRGVGYHAKSAIRVLNMERGRQPHTRKRASLDQAARQVLILLREASDRVCGKRLRPLLRRPTVGARAARVSESRRDDSSEGSSHECCDVRARHAGPKFYAN